MIVRRKPVDLTGWQLGDQAAMLDALSVLSGQGWRGALSFNPLDQVWRIELNADDPARQVIAHTGDWLVLDMGLRCLSAQEYTENYEQVDGS